MATIFKRFTGRNFNCRRVMSQFQSSSSTSIKDKIIKHTKITKNHLTPEIELCLITPECDLHRSKGEESPFTDPYWAFYWAGGQALTRYILDNREDVQGKRVLDLGSGCGATSIACLMSGAGDVTANDIDPVAAVAVQLNLNINADKLANRRYNFRTDTRDLVGGAEDSHSNNWDVIVVGDMFYDNESVHRLSVWLTRQQNLGERCRILIGDPGRQVLATHKLKRDLIVVGEYNLPADCAEESRGMHTGYVWSFRDDT